MTIPSILRIFLYVEAVLFGPFSLHHYLSFTDRKQLRHLTSNRVAWMIIHSGEMLNGVGAWVVMFVVIRALIENEISTVELEILTLAHSLWLGMILAYWPLAKEAAILHLPLTIGVFFVSWSYIPIWHICICAVMILYGRVKYWTDIYPNIVVDAEYERDMARFRDFIVPGSTDGTDGTADEETARIERQQKKRGKTKPSDALLGSTPGFNVDAA